MSPTPGAQQASRRQVWSAIAPGSSIDAGDGPYPGVVQLLDGECECGAAIKQARDPFGGVTGNQI